MRLQALFEIIKCWQFGTLQTSSGILFQAAGAATTRFAKFQTSARDEQSAVSSWLQWRSRKHWSERM